MPDLDITVKMPNSLHDCNNREI